MRWLFCYWFGSCYGVVLPSPGAVESVRVLTTSVGDGEVFLAAFLLGADTRLRDQLLLEAKNSVRGVGATAAEKLKKVFSK